MIKYCPYCRLEYSNSEIACEICKVNLVSYEEVPPKCSICKKIYSFEDSFCEKCLVELDFFQNKREDLTKDKVEYIELVTVYETINLAEVSLIKGMFEANNIHYNARGEYLQTMIGASSMSSAGTIKIDVAKKDVQRAIEIIRELNSK